MTGMILAAGFGTRLGNLTHEVPKPLVPVAGAAMIDHAVTQLLRAGCTRIVVNAHHFAGMLERHFAETPWDADIVVVHEEEILGTGGAVLNAAPWLADDSDFLVHNADIATDADLGTMLQTQRAGGGIATLLVQERPTTRALLVDPAGRFLGKESWYDPGTAPAGALRVGFCGIHAVSREIFRLGLDVRFRDIFDVYRVAMNAGQTIGTMDFSGYWTDLGTEERIRVHELRGMSAH